MSTQPVFPEKNSEGEFYPPFFVDAAGRFLRTHIPEFRCIFFMHRNRISGSSLQKAKEGPFAEIRFGTDEIAWVSLRVPEEVWNFHIGGYQVCEKWLKDRGPKKGNPGRTLTDEDIEHYQKIVVSLSETIRIMAEIDEVIEAHGGWPGAFQTGEDEETSTLEDTDDTSASMAAEEGSLYGGDE